MLFNVVWPVKYDWLVFPIITHKMAPNTIILLINSNNQTEIK